MLRRLSVPALFALALCAVPGCTEDDPPPPPAEVPWVAVAPMSVARADHTATLMQDGRLLVCGGDGGAGALASAEIFDETTDGWTSTPAMITSRTGHRAVLLSNGKVLVVDGATTGSCELYEPATGSWTATGSMSVSRSNHTLTTLANGKVLAVGLAPPGTSTELYDPATGTWTATGALNVAREFHAALLLSNGRVLVAGGVGATPASGPTPSPFGPITDWGSVSCELYDPATGTWSATGSLNAPRAAPVLTTMPNGDVLGFGGALWAWGTPKPTMEIYSVGSATWRTTTLDSPFEQVLGAGHTLLGTGDLVIAGGFSPGSQPGGPPNPSPALVPNVMRLSAATGAWEQLPALTGQRTRHTLTELWSGRLVVTGGEASVIGPPISSVEIR